MSGTRSGSAATHRNARAPRPWRPAGDRGGRGAALRHLDEGRRHRGRRIGRPYERLHGAVRDAGGLRRRRRGSGRFDIRSDDLCRRRDRTARRRLHREGNDDRASRKPVRAPGAGRNRPPICLLSAASARRAGSTISMSTMRMPIRERRPPHAAPVRHLSRPRAGRDPSRGRPGGLRNPRLRHQAPSADFRRSAVSRRLHVALPRSKAIASAATPMSCSATGSPPGPSSSRSRSPWRG